MGISAAPAAAQWVDQQIGLSSGWNSIFLEVDPYPNDSDTLFLGLPIESVWMRADAPTVAGTTTCTNPDDPSCVPDDDTGWRVWVPPAAPSRSTQSLAVMLGGRSYLIRATSAFVWEITGRPTARSTAWQVGSNHVGFYVDET